MESDSESHSNHGYEGFLAPTRQSSRRTAEIEGSSFWPLETPYNAPRASPLVSYAKTVSHQQQQAPAISQSEWWLSKDLKKANKKKELSQTEWEKEGVIKLMNLQTEVEKGVEAKVKNANQEL